LTCFATAMRNDERNQIKRGYLSAWGQDYTFGLSIFFSPRCRQNQKGPSSQPCGDGRGQVLGGTPEGATTVRKSRAASRAVAEAAESLSAGLSHLEWWAQCQFGHSVGRILAGPAIEPPPAFVRGRAPTVFRA
jgi:hypothetical protein